MALLALGVVLPVCAEAPAAAPAAAASTAAARREGEAVISALPHLVPIAPPQGSTPPAPWRLAGLPGQTKPWTRFTLETADGRRALRIEADASYGNLVHPLVHVPRAGETLAWSWQVDRLNRRADLHTREGDDTTLKVCVLWDLPMERVPFFDRQLLRLMRSRTDDPLPAATVCYVWDHEIAPGTALDSPFTRRLRYLVLRRGDEHRWVSERRDIVADFLQLFGDETREVPPLLGVAVGADADNTRSHSVGHVTDLVLGP